MALKDWKKHGSYHKTSFTFYNKKYSQVIVQIYKTLGPWTTRHKKTNFVWRVSGVLDTRDFKTKEQAFRYAKQYMRKH